MKTVIIVLIVLFHKTAFARDDLLENIRVSKANEPELNDFLKSVLRHKDDFRWIRNSVDRIRLEQLTRNLNSAPVSEEVDEDLSPSYGHSNDQENVFFETKSKRKSGLPHQYPAYRRPINDVYPYILPNEARYKRSFEYYKDDDDDGSFDADHGRSNVKVLTRSDAGVRNMPGVKIQRSHRQIECLSNHDSHEYVAPKEDAEGKKDNLTVMGEYYYSAPHDLLGISQDLKCENSRNHNATCVKTKKNVQQDNHSHVRPRETVKADRSIKVNIVDKGKLIKTVVQNENSNSLVLTFKAESDDNNLAANNNLASAIPPPQILGGVANNTAILSSESSFTGNATNNGNFTKGPRVLTNFRRLEMSNTTDDTLENIDKILQHDQDSLKNSSYLPAYLKVKKESMYEEEQMPLLLKHKQETRMVKQDDAVPDEKLLMVRNHPHINEDIISNHKYRRAEEYDEGYVEDTYNNPDQLRSDGNDENYKYRPVIYNTKQIIRNPKVRQKLSRNQAYKGHGHQVYKNGQINKHRYRDSDFKDPRFYHDKRRMRNKIKGRSDSNTETKILPNGIEETVTQDPPLNKKNLLEDETEPTSAAEQRELERKDYENQKFRTPSMDSITTEKMIVFPLKKTYHATPSDIEESDVKFNNREEYDEYAANLIDLGERPQKDDKKFHVKDSRDMIHIKNKKSNFYDDVEAIKNEVKSGKLKASVNDNKIANGHHNNFANVQYNDKNRRVGKSDHNDNVNRREAIDSHSDEDEYEQFSDDENAQDVKLEDTFHGRRILSLPENNNVMSPFDTDLDYQNGISNAINIRVKRTEDCEDVSADEDDDSAEYTNLGPKWHYEKKHVIKPKDIVPLHNLVMGAEDTLGLGDIPTCVSKRMDPVSEDMDMENKSVMQKNHANVTPKRKTAAKHDKNKPLKTDSNNDGNLEIDESPRDIVERKLSTKEENEFNNITKSVRKLPNFFSNISKSDKSKIKLNDDGSEDHESEVNKYRKLQKEKLKHMHKDSHHTHLDENGDIRTQLLNANKKHNKNVGKHKLKNKKFKEDHGKGSNKPIINDIIILKKDVQSPSINANETEQGEMRQDFAYDDPNSVGDNINLPESDPIGSPNACNTNQHDDDRNELQIIEKDKAIIFKFTTPKIYVDKGYSEKSNIEMANANEMAASNSNSNSEQIDTESNKDNCDSEEEIDNPDAEGNAENNNDSLVPELSLIRNVNGPLDSKAINKALDNQEKQVDLSDDARLFHKILGLMAKYKKPQKSMEDIMLHQEFAKPPVFIKNSSYNFDNDDIVNINHHLHKDNKAHLPKSKQSVCSKAPKHEETSDEETDSLAKDEYVNDYNENYLDKNVFFRNSIPSKSIQNLKNNYKNSSWHDLDSVESFSDIVEKQGKAKRTKKHIIYDDDILPSDFENLTQVEVEEVDNDKPTIRKKRYLKFLYKDQLSNTSQLAKSKSRRDADSGYFQDDFIRRGKRRLNDYNLNSNYNDYAGMEYNNYEPKYSRASAQNNENKYRESSIQNVPNNIRYLQSNQNLQSIQNMRNRYDVDRKYKLIKNCRNISSEFKAGNKTNASTSLVTTSSSGTVSTTIVWDHSKTTEKTNKRTNTSKKSERMNNDNMKEIMNGRLILNIIDRFTQKLKSNDVVYKRFGKRIPRQRAELLTEKLSAYRDLQTKQDIKHAEVMLHQVIIMLNRVVIDQVHRKICMQLSPDLRSYLTMITFNTCKGGKIANQIAEGYPLPELRGGNGTIAANQPPPPDDDQGDFLFETDIGGKSSKYNSSNQDLNNGESAAKKIHLIKKLLNKYNNMSASCQVKVEPVKDYLVEHLEMLQNIKNKELTVLTETTTEMDDSCADENPKPPKQSAITNVKEPEENVRVDPDSDFPNENRSTTTRKNVDVVAIRSSVPNLHCITTAASESPDSVSVKIDESSIKIEARDLVTDSSQTLANRENLQNGNFMERSVSDNFQDEDAQEVEAVKQKLIKNYGRGRFYPLSSGRYSDPIAHFQSELARENSYKEPYIMESNPFNLNLDKRPNYLDVNPLIEENQMIVNHINEAPFNQQRNYALEPEHNSMMLDALNNPLDSQQTSPQGRKRRQSVNSTTHWHGSDKYQKLVEAATELRRKRALEERLGNLFGGRSKLAKVKKRYEFKPNNAQEDYPDLSKVNFETPLIYRVV